AHHAAFRVGTARSRRTLVGLLADGLEVVGSTGRRCRNGDRPVDFAAGHPSGRGRAIGRGSGRGRAASRLLSAGSRIRTRSLAASDGGTSGGGLAGTAGGFIEDEGHVLRRSRLPLPPAWEVGPFRAQ